MNIANIALLLSPFLASLALSFYWSRKLIKEKVFKKILWKFPLYTLGSSLIVILVGEIIFYSLLFLDLLGSSPLEGGPLEIVWIPFLFWNIILSIIIAIITSSILYFKTKKRDVNVVNITH